MKTKSASKEWVNDFLFHHTVYDKKSKILWIVFIVFLIVLGFVVYKIVRTKHQNKIDKNDAESATGSTVTSTLDFNGLCEMLYQACEGLGTNEGKIYQVLGQLNTQADYMYLSLQWTSFFNKLNWWQRNKLGIVYSTDTLAGLLSSELDEQELKRCRDILTAKGISPGF